VETHADPETLASSHAYQRSKELLEGEQATLAQSQTQPRSPAKRHASEETTPSDRGPARNSL